MTGLEIIYTGGAILVGYIVFIVAIVFAAIVSTVLDKINVAVPRWITVTGKVIFYILVILLSIVFAYGMGDLVIQFVL